MEQGAAHDRILDIVVEKDEVTWQTMIYELVKHEGMNPWDVDVTLLARRYIQMLKKFKELDFRVSGKVVLAAAILLKIKSQKLLQDDIGELDRLMRAPLDAYEKEKDPNKARMYLRDRAILELLFSTGLRVSELCALNADIDLSRDELSVRGKGEKVRVVFLSNTAKDAVRAYLKARKDMDEALFLDGRSNKMHRISPRDVQRHLKSYVARAGITSVVTPHTIRHVFATDLLSNGADLRSVQALLGHANISTTQIYTHITDTHLRDIHKTFHGKRRKI